MSSPRDREALEEAVARGSDQLKAGKLEQAQRSFRMALDHDPDNERVLALLGLSYFRGNQFAEARAIYEALVERAPSEASHRLNLGLVYLKLSEADKAIAALEASRALDPSQGRAVSYLGLAYARGGRFAEAYRAFLLAGQNELASEIEANLTTSERDGIHAQLGRSPHGPSPAPSEPPTSPGAAPSSDRPPQDTLDAQAQLAAQLSSPEIVIEHVTEGEPAAPAAWLRATGSAPVTADPDAAPVASANGGSMISRAVAAASPSANASTQTRTKAGGKPPRPLSELATEALVRPQDGDTPFEITPGGALIIRVTDRVLTRLDGVHVTGGDLAYELAMRRSRGHQTEDRFDYGGSPLHQVSGQGYLIAVPGTHTFDAVSLDDDILYLREDLVFGFEASLRWESGNVPGLRGKLPIVQFRGDGALAMRLARPLVRVKLPANDVVFVDAERLAGWIGRVIPRAVVPPSGAPMGATCVECTGEGVVLVEPEPERPLVAPVAHIVAVPAAPTPRTTPPPPPPPAPAPAIDPELDMSSVFEPDPSDGQSTTAEDRAPGAASPDTANPDAPHPDAAGADAIGANAVGAEAASDASDGRDEI